MRAELSLIFGVRKLADVEGDPVPPRSPVLLIGAELERKFQGGEKRVLVGDSVRQNHADVVDFLDFQSLRQQTVHRQGVRHDGSGYVSFALRELIVKEPLIRFGIKDDVAEAGSPIAILNEFPCRSIDDTSPPVNRALLDFSGRLLLLLLLGH